MIKACFCETILDWFCESSVNPGQFLIFLDIYFKDIFFGYIAV